MCLTFARPNFSAAQTTLLTALPSTFEAEHVAFVPASLLWIQASAFTVSAWLE